MKEKLFYSSPLQVERTFDLVNEFYDNNSKSLEKLEEIFYNDFNIPTNYTKDNIKRILVDEIENKQKEQADIELMHYKYSESKNFLLYYISMFYYCFLVLFGKKESKRQYVDILFGMAPGLNETYKLLYEKLYKFTLGIFIYTPSKAYVVDSFYDQSSVKYIANASYNKYFLNSISFTILKKQFGLFFRINKLSKSIQFNLVRLVMQLQKHIAMYSTEINGIEAKFLISAHHNSFNAYRYFFYKKNLKNIMLIENGGKTQKAKLCSGECFTYCDYYIAFGKTVLRDLNNGVVCKQILYWGSLQLDKSLNELDLDQKTTKYDVVFFEQFVTYTDAGHKIEDYILCLEFLSKFSLEYPEYKIAYRVRADKRVDPSEINAEYIDKYDTILKKSNVIIDNINDSKNSYEVIFKSDVILFYVSSIGVEALAMAKKILSMNLGKRHSGIYTEEDSMCTLYDRDYDKFKEKLLYLLDKKNISSKEQFFLKLKDELTSQKENLHDELCKVIEQNI